MNQSYIQKFLTRSVTVLEGIGVKTQKILKRKKIEKISDLLWNLPQGFTDRRNLQTLDKLEIGKITTIKVKVIKYNFPRIRNLPNKVICGDEKGKIEIIFFNSREGYIKKILPLNNLVVISGKINFFNKKYQITNPNYVVPEDKEEYVAKVIPKYSLTEGLTEKVYRKLIEQVLQKITNLEEWHNIDILKKIGNKSWSESINYLHNKNDVDIKSPYYKRLAYDEILSNLLVLSQVRKRIKKQKKKNKIFNEVLSKTITKNFSFLLTEDQIRATNEINDDLKSNYKMFRILQGDVGSGKTIVSFLAAGNVINSKYQVVMMAPTEILAKQHYNFAKKIFKFTKTNVEFLTGKIKNIDKKKINKDLLDGKVDFLIGTHAVFQKNIKFKNLGLVIIDEQHKFGVKQRINLSNKGGKNCDVLLMSATPIPRTLVMTVYGDMDVSRLIEKPKNRKDIITLSKPEEKMNEIIIYIKKQVENENQIFWVCPLIEESKKLDHQSSVNKYKFLSELFPNDVALLHGKISNEEKEQILNKFLNKEYSILVSTTIIEVGIDFPNANVIIIENANKFGLSQLHQLRGRVGRGVKQASCILMFKSNISVNAKKRINILKNSNDGFEISEEDMKLRGFGDLLGFEQSGVKNFRLADPIQNEDLFLMAERQIRKIELENINIDKYKALLKLYDQADIINDIV